LPTPTGDHPITAQRQRQSPRLRYPEHSAQVKTGHGDPPMTLTLRFAGARHCLYRNFL
jgi:hypothetical protein